jgi:voltage-gated potassium channel
MIHNNRTGGFVRPISGEIAYIVSRGTKKNLKVLIGYCLFLVGLILTYAVLFQHLMLTLEGRQFSFIAGVYWVITVMTTLGFGDITFHTDAGYVFAGIVTISGVVFLLILLPFGMISFFLAPWIESRLRYQPLTRVPEDTHNHVLICGLDQITRALVRKLQARDIPFYLVLDNFDEVQRLEEDDGIKAVYGDPAKSEVLAKLRVDTARYIIVNRGDAENINITLTIRALCATPIATLADEAEHAPLLRWAGANQVVPLKKILGRYLATRATTKGAFAHVLDSFGTLLIAELPAHATPFVGKTLADSRIREQTGLAVVGLWDRGKISIPQGDTTLTEQSVMVLVGTRTQLEVLEKITGERTEQDLILIVGHGRIGCAAAACLEHWHVHFTLVDKANNPNCAEHTVVIGDATSRSFLRSAAIDQSQGLIATTNNDSANILFTLASRHLNPHIRIAARANREENVAQLYAAGADFVVSNTSVGANILMNILDNKDSIFLSEGMHIFRFPVPDSLNGKSLKDSRLRSLTGSTVIALERCTHEEPLLLPAPETILASNMTLIIIGSPEQEARCRKLLH